jgi:uncharacterized protein
VKALAALVLSCAVAGCAAQVAGDAPFVSQSGPAGDFRLGIKSWDERRFEGVIRQKYDFSCGSAALATLLTHHYDYNVREEAAFRGMWATGDRAQIRQLGFSLLDMKRWLASKGISADGYKVSLADIAKTAVPGIALIAVDNYRHFVVIKGVSHTEVLIGDPAAGLTVMPRVEFQEAWNGIYFVLSADQELARSHFNRAGQWAAYARAPIGNRFSDPVSQQALSLSAPFYRDIG